MMMMTMTMSIVMQEVIALLDTLSEKSLQTRNGGYKSEYKFSLSYRVYILST